MSDELYMRLDDAVKRVNLLCKQEFGKDCTFDEILLRQELEQICQIPSPVEVVRCKDCKWRGIAGCCALDIVVEDDKPNDDDYCSYGERKEQEHE
jgi:hypothetical protein